MRIIAILGAYLTTHLFYMALVAQQDQALYYHKSYLWLLDQSSLLREIEEQLEEILEFTDPCTLT